jgi:hypothetical protein
MKCPYQDIGCWYIDDVSHECEAHSMSDCRHETLSERLDSRENRHNDLSLNRQATGHEGCFLGASAGSTK